jgi:hypothetical protein
MKWSTKVGFIILLGAVLMVRIWIIAQAPSAFGIDPGDVHPDQGVVVLMAKHIQESGEFPIFHYGQAYLSSLEAFLLSVCYFLFGIHLWVIHIVPVFCFAVFCSALFLMTHTLYGSLAGFWALAWCIFAPVVLTEYSVMPQLGNITAPMFGTLLLSVTLIALQTNHSATKRGGYLLLGLLGGISWWTSPMTIYYLGAIPLFILIKEQGRETLTKGTLGALFFFFGAIPFFSYYALDPQLKIIGMGEGYSIRNLKNGLPLFFGERIHYFLDLEKFRSLGDIYFWAGVFIYTGAAVLFFWGLLKKTSSLLRLKHWSRLPQGFILGILFLIFLGILASSVHIHRNAPRYFLPLASFFPVALAYGVVHSPKKWRVIPILLFLLLFFIQMGITWKYVTTEAPISEAETRKRLALVKELIRRKIKVIYSWQFPGSEIINFYSKEQVIASRPMLERYGPYENVLEQSDRVTFLDPGGQTISPTLGIIGGSCRTDRITDYALYDQFSPPLRNYRELPKAGIHISASDQTEDVGKMMDHRLDTGWSSGRTRRPGMWVRIDLGQSYPLGMIRLFNPGAQHGCYSLDFEIQASQDGIHWETVVPESKMDLYYWDGPRIYYWELNYRWECRLRPVKARFILIKNHEREERFPWNIGELYIFEDLGGDGRTGFDPGPVMEKIRDLGLTRIYAGRWLSAKIKEKFRGAIQTVPIFTEASFARWPRSRVVAFGPRTGFIVDVQDQPGFEAQLNQKQIRLDQETVGRWKIYYFKNWGVSEKSLEQDKSLWWTGFGVLTVGPEIWGEFHLRGLEHWQ